MKNITKRSYQYTVLTVVYNNTNSSTSQVAGVMVYNNTNNSTSQVAGVVVYNNTNSSTSAGLLSSSARYGGADPCKHLNTSTASLKSIRSFAFSQ